MLISNTGPHKKSTLNSYLQAFRYIMGYSMMKFSGILVPFLEQIKCKHGSQYFSRVDNYLS